MVNSIMNKTGTIPLNLSINARQIDPKQIAQFANSDERMSTDLLCRLIASHYMAPDDGDQANRAKRNAARTGRVGGAEAAETAGAAPAAARLRAAAAAQRDRLEAPSIFRFRCQARQGRGRLRGKTDGVAESDQWKRRRPRGFRRGRVGFWEVGGRGKKVLV